MDYKIHLNVNHGPASERSTWIQDGQTDERTAQQGSILHISICTCNSVRLTMVLTATVPLTVSVICTGNREWVVLPGCFVDRTG